MMPLPRLGRHALQQATVAKAGLPSSSSCGLATSSSAAAPSPPGRPSRQVNPSTLDDARLASMKKGTGMRSSFSGQVCTVFGASGLIGRTVCNQLGRVGAQMILPYRGDHYKFLRLKVCGDLGQVLFTPYHLLDEESIKRSMRHSNVVINLIGREWPTRNFSLMDVNVTGPARLARIAKECGVERFVHISSINAREQPERVFLPNGSEWLRTKWIGEQAVLKEFPDATIFRPTDVYGLEDSFLDYYFSRWRQGMDHSMPLWKKGEETVKSPLYLGDIGKGIVNSLSDRNAMGQIYEAFGPERFLLSELIDWMSLKNCRDPDDYRYERTDLRTSPVAWMKTLMVEHLPIGTSWFGGLTVDKFERSSLTDDVTGQYPSLADLGVKTHRVVDKMPEEMMVYKAFAHYIPQTKADELFVPNPKPISRTEEKALQQATSQGLLESVGLK